MVKLPARKLWKRVARFRQCPNSFHARMWPVFLVGGFLRSGRADKRDRGTKPATIKVLVRIRVSESRHIGALPISANRRTSPQTHSERSLVVGGWVGGWLPGLLALRIDLRSCAEDKKSVSQKGIGIHGRITTSLGPDGRLNFAPRS